ncbi:hypothetical protein A2U01_0013565 [Trifolium medium]|uniref:Uncharacterized protein n=1 Tax=Trifolium medium TaxID=97028 RepID=A0A392N087_9FABA|nr:hypothetical protein [Trifolium medium]
MENWLPVNVMQKIAAAMPPSADVGSDVRTNSRNAAGVGVCNSGLIIMSSSIGSQAGVEWQEVWATACHQLWWWRNKERHINSNSRPRFPAQTGLKTVREYKATASKQQAIMRPTQELVQIGWLL